MCDHLPRDISCIDSANNHGGTNAPLLNTNGSSLLLFELCDLVSNIRSGFLLIIVIIKYLLYLVRVGNDRENFFDEVHCVTVNTIYLHFPDKM